MGKEARINARIRTEWNAATQSLFDRVVNRIAARNPGFNGAVYSVADPSFGLYDGRELNVFIDEMCRYGVVVKAFHAIYGINEAGDVENLHLCSTGSLDTSFEWKDTSEHHLHVCRSSEHVKYPLYALFGDIKPVRPKVRQET